jgi:hypothetical protein
VRAKKVDPAPAVWTEDVNDTVIVPPGRLSGVAAQADKPIVFAVAARVPRH